MDKTEGNIALHMNENAPADIELYPNPIQISLTSIAEKQDAGYTVDRQTDSDEYFFAYFETRVTLEDQNGQHRFEGNVFIVCPPEKHLYFRAEVPLTHTWFRMSGAGLGESIAKYKIPLYLAQPIQHLDFLSPMLENARRQMLRKKQFYEDAVTEIGRSLLRRLSRSVHSKEAEILSPFQKDLLVTLNKVRAHVFKDFRRRWTVDDIAALANMSAARFALVYRTVFNVAPIDDLIDYRMRYADLLLRYLPISIADAAEYSGFNSASNFHVLYQERVGRSPRTRHKGIGRPRPQDISADDPFAGWEEAQKVRLLYIEPTAYWSFDQPGETIEDDLKKHPAGLICGEIAKENGRGRGRELYLSGQGHIVTPEAVVDTSRSYTVCAWLMHKKAARMTAVSIGDTNHGAFYLQYVPGDGGFRFATTVSKRDHMAILLKSDIPSEDNCWYHVTGVHDAENEEIRLYIDGNLMKKGPYRSAWTSEGSTYIGACALLDQWIDRWQGGIDDVRIYDRVLSKSELITIVRHDADVKPDAVEKSKE